MIKTSYHYTNNPFLYKDDFNDNNSKCFRCVHAESFHNGTYQSPNMNIITEKEVLIKIQFKNGSFFY